MHRTEGANNASNLFTNGPPNTTVEEDWLNAVQEEIASTIEAAGLTLLTASTDTRAQLQNAIKTIGNVYGIFKDVKAANTAGGGFTNGAWRIRDLNDSQTNISGASLATNQITLPAGTYKIHATVPCYAGGAHKAKLYNVTDASDEIVGASAAALNAGPEQTVSVIFGVFTITSAKVFEIRHQCTVTQAVNGYGIQSNFAVDEVYTQVELIKTAD